MALLLRQSFGRALTLDNHSTGARLKDGRCPAQDGFYLLSGIATWIVKILAGEKREIIVPYRIEYPSFAQVLGLVQ